MSQIQNRTDNNGNRQKIEKKTPGEFNLGEFKYDYMSVEIQ